MLRDQNNPKVLAAIREVVTGNRQKAAVEVQEVNQSLASKYSGFAPVNKADKTAELQEGLSPKQKKIAKIAGNPNKIDAEDFKELRKNKDTPGNGHSHQCAIHVKHSKLGEGRTLYSQHADPAEDGTIAWYDVMFEHGIEKHVATSDLEIIMSESHSNHRK